MYANEETIQAIIDETLLRIPDKDEHKQFWKNTCIDITNFENKSIENLEPGAYIHYGALDSVHDLFPNSFNAKRNPETVAILTSCEMFVLEVDRRYKQLRYQLSGGGYVEFTDFACKIFVYNATDIDGDTGNFSRQFDFLWRSSWSSDGEGVSGVNTTLPWYDQNVFFQKYVNNEYVSTLFGYDSIVHKKGSDEYVYSFPEETGTIALLEDIPTKLSDLSNDSGYITINSVGNGTLTIQKNGTTVQTFSANQSSNNTANITVPTKLSDLTNDTGYITIGSVGNGTLTITQNGTNKGTFSANQNGNVSIALTDTTYESKSATSGGTELSLVTTGEKYAWNAKSNFSGNYSDLTGLPTLGTAAAKDVPSSGNASSTQVVLGSDTRLSDSRPASDVYSWAKASTKPTYSYSEISGAPTVNNGTLTIQRNGTNVTTFSANQSGNSTANITVPTKLSELTNDSGYTTNIGTVTQVKVGSTAYNPSSGVVSLPAYPTTLPASDVYAWAKASTKPSYTASEVGALPLSGGTMTGTINTPENNVALNFRPNNTAYSTAISYQNFGEEALVFATKMLITSFIFVNGEDSITNHASYRWTELTPGLQIKNNKVAIGKLIANGVTPTYALDVNGTVNATSYVGSGANLTGVNADTLQNSSPDESASANTIVKRTSFGQVQAAYYNMSGGADNINSFTSDVAFVSSDGWIRKTSKANFSTWLLTWTKLGSTTGNTVLTYTGTYTEFFVVLDLGFYAETFYFVASALGGNRYFFGGTTNTSDGSSWVLRAGRSKSTYSFKADRVHQDGTDYTSQVNVSVYAR